MTDIFDILGPVMVGPSSSHTAGAVRIGRMGRTLLGGMPERARIGLFGSFAETGRGHGTDMAIVAGLLGMRPDDMNIPRSFELAREAGLAWEFYELDSLRGAHPNTALLTLRAPSGRELEMQAASTGGGRIRVDRPPGRRGELHRRLQHTRNPQQGYGRPPGGCDGRALARRGEYCQYEPVPLAPGRKRPDCHRNG